MSVLYLIQDAVELLVMPSHLVLCLPSIEGSIVSEVYIPVFPDRDTDNEMSATYDEIYAQVRRIPAGRVATYGQIARLINRPRGARQVGYALAALSDEKQVPWHRVVNAQGRISRRADSDYEDHQRILLESEGVSFDEQDRIDLPRFLWKPGTDHSFR